MNFSEKKINTPPPETSNLTPSLLLSHGERVVLS
jgi:hypothetical protein